MFSLSWILVLRGIVVGLLESTGNVNHFFDWCGTATWRPYELSLTDWLIILYILFLSRLGVLCFQEPVTPTSPGPVTVGGIEFAGSIEEARQRASRKKKKDPRIQQQLSMKDKYDMFMKM